MSDVDVTARQVNGTRQYFLEHRFDLTSLDGTPSSGPYTQRASAEDAAQQLLDVLAASDD